MSSWKHYLEGSDITFRLFSPVRNSTSLASKIENVNKSLEDFDTCAFTRCIQAQSSRQLCGLQKLTAKEHWVLLAEKTSLASCYQSGKRIIFVHSALHVWFQHVHSVGWCWLC